jgi:hypothetical protein
LGMLTVLGWLIDERGEEWCDSSPNLHSKWWSHSPPPEFSKFAVRSLGFAHLKETAHGVHVSWRPTSLTAATFAGLVIALSTRADGRVFISSLTDDWFHELQPSPSSARDRLIEIFRTATCDREGYFIAQRVRPETLDSKHALRVLLAAVTTAPDKADAVQLRSMLDRHADRRYVLVHTENERDPLKVLAWGRGYERYSKPWALRRPGDDFEDQADRAYARSAADSYRQAMRTNRPVLEQVQASAWWPGQGRSAFTYTRIVIPVCVEQKGLCILSSSCHVALLKPRFQMIEKNG